MKEFEAVIKWLEECQNELDGSWCEIDSGQRGIYLVKQKIVYTSQVIRAFAATGNQEKKCVSHGLSFLRNCEEIKDDGLYDFGLKFAPFHECGRMEIARSLAERVAAKQRSGGLWEFRRSGLPFFGVLFGLEILWKAGIKGFEVYIDRGIQFLIENQQSDGWGGSPSLTSWALVILDRFGRLDELRYELDHCFEWLRNFRVRSIWKYDFEIKKDTITPQIQSDLNTTSHIVMNLSSLIRYIDRETFVDCIKSPSQRIIEYLDKDGYWIGMNKPDPFITGIAMRALAAAEKALKSPDLPFRRNRTERSLLDKLADKLEGT